MTLNQPFPAISRRSTLLIPSQPRVRSRSRRRAAAEPINSARFLANPVQHSHAESTVYVLISMLVSVAVIYAILVTLNPW